MFPLNFGSACLATGRKRRTVDTFINRAAAPDGRQPDKKPSWGVGRGERPRAQCVPEQHARQHRGAPSRRPSRSSLAQTTSVPVPRGAVAAGDHPSTSCARRRRRRSPTARTRGGAGGRRRRRARRSRPRVLAAPAHFAAAPRLLSPRRPARIRRLWRCTEIDAWASRRRRVVKAPRRPRARGAPSKSRAAARRAGTNDDVVHVGNGDGFDRYDAPSRLPALWRRRLRTVAAARERLGARRMGAAAHDRLGSSFENADGVTAQCRLADRRRRRRRRPRRSSTRSSRTAAHVPEDTRREGGDRMISRSAVEGAERGARGRWPGVDEDALEEAPSSENDVPARARRPRPGGGGARRRPRAAAQQAAADAAAERARQRRGTTARASTWSTRPTREGGEARRPAAAAAENSEAERRRRRRRPTRSTKKKKADAKAREGPVDATRRERATGATKEMDLVDSRPTATRPADTEPPLASADARLWREVLAGRARVSAEPAPAENAGARRRRSRRHGRARPRALSRRAKQRGGRR